MGSRCSHTWRDLSLCVASRETFPGLSLEVREGPRVCSKFGHPWGVKLGVRLEVRKGCGEVF
jgi:hypothetical protein